MKNSEDQIDFAASLKELEEITAWFESEEVDLDQALVKFERGMELSAELKQHLNQVENKVEKIKQKFNDPGAAPVSTLEEEAPEPGTNSDLFSDI